jgi:DNA-binding transcriptional MerR regulator
MKIAEKELTKLYYTIGEVALMFSVNASLIRFWEKEFTIIQPKKNKKGNRLFTPKDILNFNKIYNLVKEQGFTLEGAKNALKNKSLDSVEIIPQVVIQKQSAINTGQIIVNLENIKSKLSKLKNN